MLACADRIERMAARKTGRTVLLVMLILLAAAGVIWLLQWKYHKERRYDRLIVAASAKYQIDPALIKAVIWRESGFDAEAVGKAGELGLMQVMEDAAWEWAHAERFETFHHGLIRDPQRNVMCGSYYLSKLLKRYTNTDNPVVYALADYNAGRAHVLRWAKGTAVTNSQQFLAQLDYPGTKKYALEIIDKRANYASHFRR